MSFVRPTCPVPYGVCNSRWPLQHEFVRKPAARIRLANNSISTLDTSHTFVIRVITLRALINLYTLHALKYNHYSIVSLTTTVARNHHKFRLRVAPTHQCHHDYETNNLVVTMREKKKHTMWSTRTSTRVLIANNRIEVDGTRVYVSFAEQRSGSFVLFLIITYLQFTPLAFDSLCSSPIIDSCETSVNKRSYDE